MTATPATSPAIQPATGGKADGWLDRFSRPWLLNLALLLAVAATYWPTLSHDFTNYDDPEFIGENLDVQGGLSWRNVVWAFTNPLVGNWHPLTTLSHMADCQLYGLWAGGHHLTNLIFHAANTLLLFGLLRRLTGARWRSFFVAALFALHPLHVESVAWVAERKDVLSAFFGLLTLWFYQRYAAARTAGTKAAGLYFVTLLCFALGLMSKAMLVTWPCLMLLLDYWPLQRVGLSTINSQLSTLLREKIPFFALSAALCVSTLWTQHGSQSVVSLEVYSPLVRVQTAVIGCCKYLEKTFWPAKLAVFYPHPGEWPLLPSLLAALFLLTVTVLALRWLTRLPFIAVGWLWFLGTLVPVSGLVQVGSQAAADRYTYLPLTGFFIAVVWGAARIAMCWPQVRGAVVAIGVTSVIACSLVTRHQLGFWQNSETLFRHALAVTEDNHIAHYNLGAYLVRQERFKEAIPHFDASLKIRQDDKVMSNLGVALLGIGMVDEAIERQREALRMNPTDPITMGNLGVAFIRKGQPAEAVEQFKAALRVKPDHVETLSNLGGALSILGRYDEAITNYQHALELRPDFITIRQNYAMLLVKAGRKAAATVEFRELLRVSPDNAGWHNSLGRLLADQGLNAEAVAEYQSALRLQPDFTLAHQNLGEAFIALGRKVEARPHFLAAAKVDGGTADMYQQLGEMFLAEGDKANAIHHWRKAVQLNPNSTQIPNNLAWMLATDRDPALRNGADAVKLAENCARLTQSNNYAILDTLAAAYAEAGKFTEAAATAQRALNLAMNETDKKMAAAIRGRLEVYKSNQPYRE